MPARSYRWEVRYQVEPRGRSRPILPVVFSYTRLTRSYDGLVDSGAERSVCPIEAARAAGVDTDAFPVRRIRGIGGITRGRLCPMDLLILGRRIGTEPLVVEANVVLLGRRDVFAALQFGFDERATTLLIEPYDET